MPDAVTFIRPTIQVDAATITPHPAFIDFQNGAVRVQQDPTDAGVVQVRVGFALNTDVTLGTETTSAGAGNTTTLQAGDGVGAGNNGGNIVLAPGLSGGGAGLDGGVAIGIDETELVVSGVTVDARLMIHDGTPNTLLGLVIDKHNNAAAAGALFTGARTRGTEAAPLVVADNDTILGLFALGFDGTDYEQAGAMLFEVDDPTPSGTSMGGAFVVRTTPRTTVAPVERLRIAHDGVVTVAGTLEVNTIQPPTGTALAINRQDGTAWATTDSGSGVTVVGIQTDHTATVLMRDNIITSYGTGSDFQTRWSTAQATGNSMLFGIGVGSAAQGGNLILTAVGNVSRDHDHPVAANPTLIIHSQEDPDLSNDQFISFAHNTTDAVLTVGTGDLEIGAAQVRAPSGSSLVLARADGGAWVTITPTNRAQLSAVTTQVLDNGVLEFGTGNDVQIDWSTAQATANSLVLGVGVGSAAQGGNVIITAQGNVNQDHDRPVATNPTAYVFSATDPDTANDEWVSISHDTTDANISVGSGAVILNTDDGVRVKTSGGNNALIRVTGGSDEVFDIRGDTGITSLQVVMGGSSLTMQSSTTGGTAHNFAQPANTSGTPKLLLATGAAHTGLANANLVDIDFALDRNITFTGGGGAFDHYRGIEIQAPTLIGSAAQTITNPATLYVAGPPAAGANMTFTNGPYAVFIDDGDVRIDGQILSNAGAQVICDTAGALHSAGGANFGPAAPVSLTIVDGIVTAAA